METQPATATLMPGSVRRLVRPRPGDTWEIKLPNRPKKTKRIGSVRRIWMRSSKPGRGNENGNVKRMYVSWYRLPKGRYSGIALKGLLKYGRLIQSNAARVAQEEARMERVRAKWPNNEVSEGGALTQDKPKSENRTSLD